jgi:enediyne biosynthesis protein E4
MKPRCKLMPSLSFGQSVLILAVAVNSSGANLFTKITSDPVVSNSRTPVAAWGDFNNDGFIDLIAAPYNGSNLLYTNNGNGTFARVTTGVVAADSGNSFGCIWGDYDNDGALDLFVSVNSGSDWLYRNNGNGTFTKITTGPVVTSGGNGNNCAWGDYDNDGYIDLFVANSDQNDFLYHNNGNGTFTKTTDNAIASKAGNSQGASWGDYNNDGLLDLFVSRVNQPNLLYRNLGGGSFVAITNGLIVNESTASQGVSWGDYDNDGYLDLFVANPNARNFLYHNNGDGSFTKITNGTIATDVGNAHGCSWADYDNDGYLDLVVINRLGPSFLYHNNGDSSFTRLANGEPIVTDGGEAFSGAWGDYNNDGFPDLFLAHWTTFNSALYRNNGNSNHWITIKCEGRLSNRAAIGAKVRLKATIGGRVLWQMRDISGGGGLGSQNDLRAGFGLGDAAHAEIVRVEWPSGIVQQVTNVAARQILTIIEPNAWITPRAQEVQAQEPATFTLSTTLAPPVHFQWKLNDVALPGETNATLVIGKVQTNHAGAYSVAVSQPATGMSFETPPALLTGPVIISRQPTNMNVEVGSNTLFTVQASGINPLHFQWRSNGADIPGATNATLVLSNVAVADEAIYSVLVSNSYGWISSSAAVLVVLVKPLVTIGPLSQSVAAGSTVTLSASATGHPFPLTYRWLKNGVPIAAITVADTNCFFTVTNVQLPVGQLAYRVSVTNLAGSANSTAALLTVLMDTDADGLPNNWEIEEGLDPNNALDATEDDDGDGMTNLAEYRAGTDPNNPADRQTLTIERKGSHTSSLHFIVVSNRTYTLEERDTVSGGNWNRCFDITAVATNRFVEWFVPTNISPQFFRLRTPACGRSRDL